MHEITIHEDGTFGVVCLEDPGDTERTCARWSNICRIVEWFEATDPWEVRRRHITVLHGRTTPGTYRLMYKQDGFNGQVWDWYAADRN